jgi:hypothetical protein
VALRSRAAIRDKSVVAPTCCRKGIIALLRCLSFGQVVCLPAANVENNGVVVVDVRSVGRRFALPNAGTVPFAEGVAAESQPEIGVSPILKSKL